LNDWRLKFGWSLERKDENLLSKQKMRGY
jgi:hypothetical protein